MIGEKFSPEEVEIYIALLQEYRNVFSWMYEDIPRIEPWIVEHEIKTYPNAKIVRHKLQVVNPRKVPTIKAS